MWLCTTRRELLSLLSFFSSRSNGTVIQNVVAYELVETSAKPFPLCCTCMVTRALDLCNNKKKRCRVLFLSSVSSSGKTTNCTI